MTSRHARSSDAVRNVLERLRPAGVTGKPPTWLKGLLEHGDWDLILADARSTPPAIAMAWLAPLLSDDGLDALDELGPSDFVGNVIEFVGSVARTEGAPVEAATDAVVNALLSTDPRWTAHDSARSVLIELGAAHGEAREILLAAHAAAGSTTDTDLYEEILASTCADDPRVRAILLRRLELEPERGATLCAIHGDPRFVAPLRAAWDACPEVPDTTDVDRARSVCELGCALEDLGHAFDDAGTAKRVAYEQVAYADRASPDATPTGDAAFDDDAFDGGDESEREDLAEELNYLLDEADAGTRGDPAESPLTRALDDARGLEPVGPPVPPLARKPTPGRNEPCWCGSGQKYKKCHLDADAAQA